MAWLSSGSPTTGDCLLVHLGWRPRGHPPRPCHAALPTGPVVWRRWPLAQGLAATCSSEARTTAEQFHRPNVVSALAGAGKTALAHWVVSGMHSWRGTATPLHGALSYDTVPTRALREEVVLELLKVKAALVSACFIDVCANCSGVRPCQKFVAIRTLPTWKGGLYQ